ncbi:hypothetical protein C5167_025846 [Papaver somniferum]|uniref:AB hydrolase-1 domain-containing protein n=1 Tax=Papaver somniferum TaxID=3469 RepID=A0A4Y7JU37_PAPSO|nr:uncharacterized protein LOC113278553 [Papaver somniferum]RZC64076.1 hypothetical protein C5167_025846 [Papaver somniferum]
MESSTSCFSLVSFEEKFHRRTFKSSNLSPQTINIDSETTINVWAPNKSSKATVFKPSLVLLHGFAFNPLWNWCNQVKFLSNHFCLYIPELIFTGKSTTTSSERTEIFQAVSIGKVMDHLGVKTYSVVGSSYGGFVAYHMARLFPEKIEKVVIANSAINMRLKDNEELLKKINFEKIEDLLLPVKASQLRMLLSLTYYKPPFSPDFLLKDIIKTTMSDREENLQLLKGLTIGKSNTVEISILQQQVLIIWGEYDGLFPVEKAYELKELLGEKVSLEVIKKTSHEPMLENPKLFNDIIMKFVTDH